MLFPSSGVRRVVSNPASSSKAPVAGTLIYKDGAGHTITKRPVYAHKEIIVGRDRGKCQWTIDDPRISRKHVRIYSVVYDAEEIEHAETLVYAEDLSQHGTFWNGAYIGKGSGGFLLSQDDCLKLSHNVFLHFRAHRNSNETTYFDFVQEREMKGFADTYILTDRILGSGVSARVFMAVEQQSRSQLACKMVDLRKLRSQYFVGRAEAPAAAEFVNNRAELRKVKTLGENTRHENRLEAKLKVYYREFEILISLNHPNITALEKVIVTDNTLYMFQQLITAGDLFSYLEYKNGKLLEVEAAAIVRQIVIALCYIHGKNIVHRDLKPENILMTSLSAGCRIVLTDFGAARKVDRHTERMSTIVGTDGYAAPEITKRDGTSRSRSGYSKAIDLWSLGCVTVILLTGGSPFADPHTGNYSAALAAKCNLEFLKQRADWQIVRPRPQAFVARLLTLEESERMTSDEALQHDWFSNEAHKVDFADLYHRTIRHWSPRQPVEKIVELKDAWDIQDMQSLRNLLPDRGDRRGSSVRKEHLPQEAHLKPFATNVFNRLHPRPSSRRSLRSPEVRAAIEEYWSDLSSDNEEKVTPKITTDKAKKVNVPAVTKTNSLKPSTSKDFHRQEGLQNSLTCAQLTGNSTDRYAGPSTTPSASPARRLLGRRTTRPPRLIRRHSSRSDPSPFLSVRAVDERDRFLLPGPNAEIIARKETGDLFGVEQQRGIETAPDCPFLEHPVIRRCNDSSTKITGSDTKANIPRTLRRRSFTPVNASPGTRNKRRSSIFDLHEDSSEPADSTKSRVTPKRLKDCTLQAAQEPQELVLPHFQAIVATRHLANSDELYLPR